MLTSEVHPLRLYKKQKLCSATAIDRLFAQPPGAGNSHLAYPLRMVFARNDGRRSDAPVQFAISIPKKRIRHAVDRVTMRRRVREAFRLNHQNYPMGDGARYDVVFIYVANNLLEYKQVEKAVKKHLQHLASLATIEGGAQ